MKGVSKGVVVYVVVIALILTWAYFVQTDTRRVDGYSMLPTLEGGDLVVLQGVPFNQIHAGDIIVYNSLCSTSGLSVVHRVVNVTSTGLTTKGDNNPGTDQALHIAKGPVTAQCVEGKVVYVIPYLELLASYIDANGLPQWYNNIPSLLILLLALLFLGGLWEKGPSTEPKKEQGTPGQ